MLSTAQHKHRRPPMPPELSNSGSSEASTSVTSGSIKQASRKRLCCDLCQLINHMESVHQIPNRNSKMCVVCGKDCYHVCTKCVGEDGRQGVTMHAAPNLTGKKGADGVPCYMHYHNTSFYGLACSDYKLTGLSAKKDWKSPTVHQRAEHRRKIRRVLDTDSVLVNRRLHDGGAVVNNNNNNNNGVNWNNMI